MLLLTDCFRSQITISRNGQSCRRISFFYPNYNVCVPTKLRCRPKESGALKCYYISVIPHTNNKSEAVLSFTEKNWGVKNGSPDDHLKVSNCSLTPRRCHFDIRKVKNNTFQGLNDTFGDILTSKSCLTTPWDFFVKK